MGKGACTDALTKICAGCLLCFLCSVDSSRWFTWVVRVGAPSKILKPAPFPDLKVGHVDHLLTCVYFSKLCLLLP